MNGRLAGTLGVWVVAGAALAAADFWETKHFTTWSDKEVEKILTDSPWSREVGVPLGRLRGAGVDAESSRLGRPSTDGDGQDGPTSSRPRDSRPSQSLLPRRLDLTISWRSALPFKQALVQAEVGIDGKIPPERQEFLAQDVPFYLVSVGGFPERFAQLIQSRALMPETRLKRENADPISPNDIEVYLHNESVVVLCYFPRTDSITLEDKDVEFITKLGPMEIKKKFKLEDMMFAGQLAL